MRNAGRLLLGLLLCVLMTDAKAGPRWQAFKNWIDSADVKGADSLYVRLPEQGFVAYLNTYLTGTHIRLDYEHEETADRINNFSGILSTRASALVSLACTYRGWGLSYSRDLSNYNDTEWSFMTYGQAYGAEFRIHNSNSLSGDLENKTILPTEEVVSVNIDDCHQRTILAGLYYVVNHRRFSLPAAMSHTVLQLRSSGSWILVANYHNQRTDVDRGVLSSMLGFEISKMGLKGRSCLNRLRQSELSIGAGYAYNWVFANSHCLLHASLLPLLSVWHSNRSYHSVELKNEAGVVIEEAQKLSYAIKQDMSLNAKMNLSFVYNKGRYLTGAQWLLNFDTMNEHYGYLSLYSLDSSARLFIGVRF